MGQRIRLLAALWLFTAFLSLPVCAGAAADAVPALRQLANYNIYNGGLKTFSAELEVTEPTPDNYRMIMNARTEGLLNLFTDWQGTMETKGSFNGSEARPLFHKSVSVWPHNTQVKEFAWTGNGNLADLYILDEGKTRGLNDIQDGMAYNAVDIMTASLALMEAVARKNSCEEETEVFDGKRRFVLAGINQGTEYLNASRYNRFEGEAIRCEIRIIPQEGNWHEKLKGWMSIQEQGKEAGAVPTVWLAELEKGAPAIPVKMKAKTSYGTFLMHLTGYKADKLTHTADSR